MSRTAFQLGGPAHAALLYGTPLALRRGGHGPIALFDPGEIVAYCLQPAPRPRLYVVRTTDARPAMLYEVEGIYPHADVLLEVRTRARITRVAQAFRALQRRDVNPDALPDAFFVRLANLIGRRVPVPRLVEQLLLDHGPAPIR